MTRWVRAEPDEVYQALLDPFAVAAWRVPNGMSAKIHEFDAREGGRFRISLHPDAAGEASRQRRGRSTDASRGLLPDRLVVEAIEFESPEPSDGWHPDDHHGAARGRRRNCEVTMVYDDIPDAAQGAVDDVALQMALVRLAAWVEDDRRW